MAEALGNTKLASEEGIRPGGPYLMELLFDAPPKLDRKALGDALAKRLGRIDRSDEKGYTFALLDHVSKFTDGAVPAMISYMEAERENRPKDPRERFASALQQTWDWDAAGQVLAQARHSILVTDFMAGGLDRKTRVTIIDAALRAAIETTPVKAIAVLPSDRIVDPTRYVQARTLGDQLKALFLNVRFYSVGNGVGKEAVMDSLGLQIFGIPDVQCHFVEADPGEFAGFLFGCSAYLFEKGDVFADGDTVPGRDGDRWPCQHEMSIAPPKRVVVDIRPGRYAPASRK